MSKVIMKVGISGPRSDGSDWPRRGEALECEAEEAEHLLSAGLAQEEPVDEPTSVTVGSFVSQPDADAEGDEPAEEPQPDADAEGDEPAEEPQPKRTRTRKT